VERAPDDVLLITGGNGLLGTKLIEVCLRSGCARPVSASRQPCSNGFLGAFDFFQVDVAEARATTELLERVRPRRVVHTAAMTDVDGCERAPEAAWRANVEGAASVARDDPTNPISVYGRTKLESEMIVRESCPGAAVARTTVLYGYAPNVRPNFVIWLVGQLRAGQPVRVVDDQIGSPTLADNLAEMCLALALGGASGVYHTVGADRLNRHAFARIVAEVFRLDAELIGPVSTASLNQAAPRPLRAGLRTEKLRRDFPDVPVLGAREGLEVLREQLPG
jgi:dTDP-4-dehydrorhamnose reductase